MRLPTWASVKAFYRSHRYLIAGTAVLLAFVLLAVTNVAIRHTRQAALHAMSAQANLAGEDDCEMDDFWWDFFMAFKVDICDYGYNVGGGGDAFWGSGGSGNSPTNNLWGGQNCPPGHVRTTGGSCMDESICLGPGALGNAECGIVNVDGGVAPNNPHPPEQYSSPCGPGYYWNSVDNSCNLSGGQNNGSNGSIGTGGGSGHGQPLVPVNGNCADWDVYNSNDVCGSRPVGKDCVENGVLVYCPGDGLYVTPTPISPTPDNCWDGLVPNGAAGCNPIPTSRTPNPTSGPADCAGEANTQDCDYTYTAPGRSVPTEEGGSNPGWFKRLFNKLWSW